MIRKHSLGFIAAALVAGVATTVICIGEAFNLVHAQAVPFEATTRPLDVAIGDCTLMIEFSRPGVRAYSFTFG